MLIAMNPAHLRPGQMVDGWRVVRLLGSGTFGAVYLVEKDGQRFAMKIAMHRASSGDVELADERLMREQGCLHQVRGHPNIVRMHAHGRWPDPMQGWLYVILDYVDGYTLGEWVEKLHPTAQEVVRVFVKLAGALAHVHARGAFHRDLKPGNLLVRASDGEPFILDFSAGDYPHAPELTDTPLPPGTRRYRSPEASRFLREHGDEHGARYEFKATDDVYALGVCLYDMLTMAKPASESPRILVGSPVPPPAPHALNPRVPDALSATAQYFIARQPEKRAPTAEVMRRQLEALLSQVSGEWAVPLHMPAPPLQLASAAPGEEGPWVSPRPPQRRVAGMVAAVTLLVAALAGHALLRPAAPVTQAPETPAPATPSVARDAGAGPLTTTSPPAPAIVPPEVALPPPAPLQKESPAVKRAPVPITPPAESTDRKPKSQASRPNWPLSPWTVFLRTCAGATAAAALQLGCPGAQVRPEPADCPSEARDVMFNWYRKDGLRLEPGDSISLTLDTRQPGEEGEPGVYSDGPVTGVVSHSNLKGLPEGTLLSGYLWTGAEGVAVGRYTEARFPDGRRVPVCIVLGRRGFMEKSDGSKPGAAVLNRAFPAYAVERWP
jgi:serine/threonine-protein kinase